MLRERVQPFPSNPTFQPRPPVSEATKSSIYASVKSKIRAAVREAAQDGSTRSASAVKEGPILREVAQKHNISVLRLRAIVKLKVLEEFCSLRDELFLATADRFEQEQVWGSWAQLQRLALYNVDTSWTPFLKALEQVTALTHLVLTRADGLGDEIEDEKLRIPQSLTCVKVVNIRESRPFGYIVPSHHNSFLGQLPDLFKAAEEKDGRARELQEIYVPALNDKDLEDPITLCQDFVKHHACTGSLWNLKPLPLDVVDTAQENA